MQLRRKRDFASVQYSNSKDVALCLYIELAVLLPSRICQPGADLSGIFSFHSEALSLSLEKILASR
jgi:hypothetical protein